MNRTIAILSGIVALAVIGGAGYVGVRTNMARTIRLNNPGAIRKSNIGWLGKVATSDTDLEAFSSPAYGARAMLVNMRTNYNNGYRSIGALVTRWSGGENATAYALSVSEAVGIPQTVTFAWDEDTVTKIAKAMADWETGISWFPQSLFLQAWRAM